MAGKKLERPRKDLTGVRFNKLVIMGFSHWSPDKIGKDGKIHRYSYWNCQCDCGTIKAIPLPNLTGGSMSCGCYKSEWPVNKAKEIEEKNQAAKRVYANYKYAAKRRNYSFDITLEEFINIAQQNCYLCGESPSGITNPKSLSLNAKQFMFNGIDRFDNSIGYKIDNCKPCCKACNYMKLNTDIKTFVRKMRKIIYTIDNNSELLNLVSEDYVNYGNN